MGVSFMDLYEEEAIVNVLEEKVTLKLRFTQYIERFTYQLSPETRTKVKYCAFGVIPTCIFFFVLIGILFPLSLQLSAILNTKSPHKTSSLSFQGNTKSPLMSLQSQIAQILSNHGSMNGTKLANIFNWI